MIKVLQISKYYYPFIGGIEQVARDISRSLDRNIFQQKIICFNEDSRAEGYECHRKQTVHDFVDGVEVIRCGYSVKISSQSLSASYGRELQKLMDGFRPDIVILHYPNPFVTRLLLKYKDRDFRLMVYWHLDITKQRFLKCFFVRQNRALIDRACVIAGATPVHLETSEYSSHFSGKKHILPYMIDEGALIPTPEEKQKAGEIRKAAGSKVIGFFIGRHVPYKGLRYLIEASEKMGDEDIHFFIAGEGELTDKLKALAGNDRKIEFVGRISDSEKRAYLCASDIICFPSVTRNEAFGLALAEGMYSGKPAVTFNIKGSGVNYVSLDGVTGIECPCGDSEAYAGALKKLCSDSALRREYGKNARRRVLDNFTGESFRKNINSLLSDIIENR